MHPQNMLMRNGGRGGGGCIDLLTFDLINPKDALDILPFTNKLYTPTTRLRRFVAPFLYINRYYYYCYKLVFGCCGLIYQINYYTQSLCK